jgi:tRNA pseudouridine38-40 synthase
MPNIKLTLEYDGTDFVGWQLQENGRSVQGELEKALRQILQQEIRAHGAGRTDSGVHAREQVANFYVAEKIDGGLLLKALNALLPEDVVAFELEEVPDNFHARFSATSRSYEYVVEQRPTAIGRKYCWFNTYAIDRILLEHCAAEVIGIHNFRSFCKTGNDSHDFECSVSVSSWSVEGTRFAYRITANRFLYGMVRALVGTMVEVARGHRPYDEFRRILLANDRGKAGMSAPAQGLFLTKVGY